MTPGRKPRLSIDIGGTFTDTLLVSNGAIHTEKTPTTNDLITGCLTGLERVCERAGVDPSDIDSFSHGSTAAINAFIEETGGKTALVATEGFRDVLEMGTAHRNQALLYNLCGLADPPLVPRQHRYEVTERIDASGQVVTPLETATVDDAVRSMQDGGVECVAVCLLNAHANPEHEQAVLDRIKDAAPGLTVSASSTVSPRIREYNRTCTTVIDAYIKPTVEDYLDRLATAFAHEGVTADIRCMQSDGGTTHHHIATDRPITQILSGPVGGVKAAQYAGRLAGEPDLLSLDMGGTSADTALISGGDPMEEPTREFRGMTVNGPFVKIHTAGAGGGSIAWLNDVDALRVGPRSAGADPGPACYARGGTQPTVTDADLELGVLSPDTFAVADKRLDRARARDAIEAVVADPLGLSVREAALAIREVIDNKLADALRVVSVREGHDPRDFSLISFGGAGPMHACAVARQLGVERVVFPAHPGVFSALGLLTSDVKHTYQQSVLETTDAADATDINTAIEAMMASGRRDLDREGVPASHREFAVSFDMLYTGQATPLNIPYSRDRIGTDGLDELAAAFKANYERRFGIVNEHARVEILAARVTATGATDRPDLAPPSTATTIDDARRGTRDVAATGKQVAASVYDWRAVPTGAVIQGPAVIELETATIWLAPDYVAEVHATRSIVATREADQ